MTDKNLIIKKDVNLKTNCDMVSLVEKKIEFFKDVIQKTIIHVYKNKSLDILGISDVNSCIERLGEISKKIQEISDIKNNADNIINALQIINNDLSSLLKNYGTDSLEDLLLICFGSNNKITTTAQWLCCLRLIDQEGLEVFLLLLYNYNYNNNYYYYKIMLLL